MRRKVVLETSCDDGPDLSSLPSTTLRLPDILLLMPASRKSLHHGNEEASSRGDYSRNSEPSFFITLSIIIIADSRHRLMILFVNRCIIN